ncbi:MAG TPA: hypothetical protein PK400_12835 [Phycisphaerales bacterium]|nr:hypothetical protein [Phycisphaerales bacterium]HRQ74978.1 hypothetical protein [Phycisphaerales bacterium]
MIHLPSGLCSRQVTINLAAGKLDQGSHETPQSNYTPDISESRPKHPGETQKMP